MSLKCICLTSVKCITSFLMHHSELLSYSVLHWSAHSSQCKAVCWKVVTALKVVIHFALLHTKQNCSRVNVHLAFGCFLCGSPVCCSFKSYIRYFMFLHLFVYIGAGRALCTIKKIRLCFSDCVLITDVKICC